MFFLYIGCRYKQSINMAIANKKMVSKKETLPTNLKSKVNKKDKVKNPVQAEPDYSGKESANKLVLEYIIHSSPHLLFEFISSPSGLSEWFADDVNVIGNIYTFKWDGAMQQADIVASKEGRFIRLHWTDRPVGTYFEMKIDRNELTHELSLIVTDFAETADEKNSLEVLWQEQIQNLMKVLGSKA